MDRISSGIVDIICAQTRARAASDKLYETQRVQSGVAGTAAALTGAASVSGPSSTGAK